MNIRWSIQKHKQRGALFVEAAFVIPFLIYLIINLIYFAFLLHDYVCLNNMTRSCVRYAAVEASSVSSSSTSSNEGPASTIETRAANVRNYLQNGVAEELVVYHLNVSEVKARERQGEITEAGGYIFTSGTGDKEAITVVLAAKRGDDYPIIISKVLPEVIISSLKMKLEQ